MMISIIVPVYNGGSDFVRCLADLNASAPPPLEVIVVDDGSTDDSAQQARALGFRVLSTATPRSGPAKARNIGAHAATGDVLFFIDADVCVQPDSVARVQAAFESDPELDALIGSYDDDPAHQDFLSQYKNLMHAYVHQSAREQACTFWSGCGAVRRTVFLKHAGFDESYGRPAIEDIELGFRMARANHKMILDKDLRVKHLKRWTFWKLVRTDVMDRGIPWTELILRDRSMPNDLNLQISQRVSVALAFLLLLSALGIAVYFKGYALTPLLGLLLFYMARYWVYRDDSEPSRFRFVFMTAGMIALVVLAEAHQMLPIIPPIVLGYLALFLRHRYSSSHSRYGRVASFVFMAYAAVTTLFIVTYLPGHFLTLAFALVFIALLILNNEFYVFLAAKRGKPFAIAAIPFHLLYHFYNGISFSVGLIRHTWRSLRKPKPATLKS
jgi:glycosyltransferase involved in cell wall biosynthesis